MLATGFSGFLAMARFPHMPAPDVPAAGVLNLPAPGTPAANDPGGPATVAPAANLAMASAPHTPAPGDPAMGAAGDEQATLQRLIESNRAKAMARKRARLEAVLPRPWEDEESCSAGAHAHMSAD